MNDGQVANIRANLASQEVASVNEGANTTCERVDDFNKSKDSIIYIYIYVYMGFCNAI